MLSNHAPVVRDFSVLTTMSTLRTLMIVWEDSESIAEDMVSQARAAMPQLVSARICSSSSRDWNKFSDLDQALG
jgi:hypothetical protein